MVIQEDGNMLTAKAEPKMVLITTELKEGILTLNAPEMPVLNVKIPLNSKQAISCRYLIYSFCLFYVSNYH